MFCFILSPFSPHPPFSSSSIPQQKHRPVSCSARVVQILLFHFSAFFFGAFGVWGGGVGRGQRGGGWSRGVGRGRGGMVGVGGKEKGKRIHFKILYPLISTKKLLYNSSHSSPQTLQNTSPPPKPDLRFPFP